MFKKYKNLLLASSLGVFSLTVAHISASAVTVPPGVELAKEQVLRIANGAEPASLDPDKATSVESTTILSALFESLIQFDGNGKIFPAAATDWEIADDNKQITFHLRKDAKWSNGDPVTAHDFVYATQRGINPDNGLPFAQDALESKVLNVPEAYKKEKPLESIGVKALDDYTLQITLSKPDPDLLVTQGKMKPLHKKTLETYGDKWTQPENMVVNGAFVLKKWNPRDKVILEKNPYYWDKAHVILERLIFLPVIGNTAYNLYRTNALDYGTVIPPELYERDKDVLKDDLVHRPSSCSAIYGLNLKAKSLKDKRVRQALSMGIDREVIAKRINVPPQEPNYTMGKSFYPEFDMNPPAWAKLPDSERYAKAKQLLKEAGYDENNPLKIKLSYSYSEKSQKLTVAAQSMFLKNIGVQTTLDQDDWKVFLDKREKGDFELALLMMCYYSDSALPIISEYKTNQDYRPPFYHNPKIDAFYEALLYTNDQTTRTALIREAQATIDNDYVVINLFSTINHMLKKPYVGVEMGDNPTHPPQWKDFYIIKH